MDDTVFFNVSCQGLVPVRGLFQNNFIRLEIDCKR